jgi:hypothetical protein
VRSNPATHFLMPSLISARAKSGVHFGDFWRPTSNKILCDRVESPVNLEAAHLPTAALVHHVPCQPSSRDGFHRARADARRLWTLAQPHPATLPNLQQTQAAATSRGYCPLLSALSRFSQQPVHQRPPYMKLCSHPTGMCLLRVLAHACAFRAVSPGQAPHMHVCT